MTWDWGVDGLVIFGVLLLVISGVGFYWLATGNFGASYAVTEVTPVSEASDSSEVVDYSRLPAPAQASFDAALHGDNGNHKIWESDNPEAVRSLLDHSYVRKDGQLYQYVVVHGDNFGPGILGILPFLFGIVGILLVGFGIDKRYGLSILRRAS